MAKAPRQGKKNHLRRSEMFYKRLQSTPVLLAGVTIIAGYASCILELARPLV